MIWHSDRPPVEVGGITLDAMVRATAARLPHRPALVDGESGDGVTYAELVRRADRVAALLAERGLGPGDVLAVWLPNVPAWAGVALGALRAGVAVTGVSPAATDEELAAQLDDSGAKLVVTLPGLALARARARRDRGRSRPARRPRPGAVGDRRDRAAALLERDDRAAQGRRHHAPQPLDRRAPVPGRPATHRARHARGCRAVRARHGLRAEPGGPARGRGDRRDDAALRAGALPRARGAPPRDGADRRAAADAAAGRRARAAATSS